MDPVLIWDLVSGFAGGVLSFLLFHGILTLRLFRLQLAVQSLREGLLSVRNTDKAVKRWNQRDLFEAELLRMQNEPKPKAERFVNDPLG